MQRTINNAIGFLLGMLAIGVLFLSMLPTNAHAAQPKLPAYMAVLFAIQDGRVIGAKVLGMADSADGCSQGIVQAANDIAAIKLPEGVTVMTGCIELHQPQSI